MAKKRATQHNGRKSNKGAFSPKHNDRNYDYELADNIKADLTETNSYWNCYDGSYKHKNKENKLTFEETEQRYYEENFKAQWLATNQRYIEQRHPEKCKPWDEWKQLNMNLPEESYFQIGDKENPCDKATFVKVFNSYNKKLNQWNNSHGKPFQMLDMAFHFDEAVPQAHTRRIWSYTDSNGIKCVGQEQALKQAGIQLPHPEKKKNRYNNRKMVFDKMCRELYLESCLECGLDIETVPLEGVRHNMTKDETINAKLAKQQKELEAEKEALEAQKQAFEVYKQETTEKLTKTLYEANTMLKECKELHKNLKFQSKSYLDNPISKIQERNMVKLDRNLELAYDIANQSRNKEGWQYE